MATNDGKQSTDREDITLSSSELDDVISSADIRSEAGDADDSNLEKYGIWIKMKPETLEPAAEAEGAFELSDLEAGLEREAKLTAEEEKLLGELESEVPTGTQSAEATDFEGLEKDLQELGKAGSAEEDEELTVADLDLDLDELAGEQAAEAEIEVPLSESADVEEPFAAISPLEEELAPAAAGAAAAARTSTAEILKKIETDLRQIKAEIQNLKKELSGLGRLGAAAEVEVPPAPTATPGFFAEEEDDTIALTGDELDNILNTADITEEPAGGALAGLGEELPLAEVDLESLGEAAGQAEAIDLEAELSPATGKAPAEAPALDEIIEPGAITLEEEAPAVEMEEIELDIGGRPALEVPEEALVDLEALEEAPAIEELGLPEAEEELLLEELAEAPGEEPAEELTLEEVGPPDKELSLEEFSGIGEEPAVLETMPESIPAAGEDAVAALEEEFPELELSREQLGIPEEAEELELAEELEAAGAKVQAPAVETPKLGTGSRSLPEDLREDVKSVLSYLDQLLEALPEDKIRQFAQSEYFGIYKRLFDELGLGA